ARDHRDVVIDHADIGALICAGLAHSIGEQLTADNNGVAACRGALDQRPDIALGDRRFDEDGADLPFYEDADKIFNLPETGLALGGDTLDAEHLIAIGAAEIVE